MKYLKLVARHSKGGNFNKMDFWCVWLCCVAVCESQPMSSEMYIFRDVFLNRIYMFIKHNEHLVFYQSMDVKCHSKQYMNVFPGGVKWSWRVSLSELLNLFFVVTCYVASPALCVSSDVDFHGIINDNDERLFQCPWESAASSCPAAHVLKPQSRRLGAAHLNPFPSIFRGTGLVGLVVLFTRTPQPVSLATRALNSPLQPKK